MSTVNVTEATFEATVKEGHEGKSGIVLLDFWAGWCGPCRAFAPVFEAASRRHPDVVFGKIDTESEPGLAAAFEIRAIPTLMILRDGILLGTFPGAMSAARLDELVDKVRSLDMEQVRRDIAKDETTTPSAAKGAA